MIDDASLCSCVYIYYYIFLFKVSDGNAGRQFGEDLGIRGVFIYLSICLLLVVSCAMTFVGSAKFANMKK